MENCSRAISVAPCSWPAVLAMNLERTYTGKRSKSDDELLSFPALASDCKGPLRKLAEDYVAAREEHRRKTGHVFRSIIICSMSGFRLSKT